MLDSLDSKHTARSLGLDPDPESGLEHCPEYVDRAALPSPMSTKAITSGPKPYLSRAVDRTSRNGRNG